MNLRSFKKVWFIFVSNNNFLLIMSRRKCNFLLTILLYKVVMVFCLKIKILVTTELIGFSILSKLYIGLVMVLGYFIFKFMSLLSAFFLAPLNTEPLDARGTYASLI